MSEKKKKGTRIWPFLGDLSLLKIPVRVLMKFRYWCTVCTGWCIYPSISVKFAGLNAKPLIWVVKSCTHVYCASLEYMSTFTSINAIIFRVLLSNWINSHQHSCKSREDFYWSSLWSTASLFFPFKKGEQRHKRKATKLWHLKRDNEDLFSKKLIIIT